MFFLVYLLTITTDSLFWYERMGLAVLCKCIFYIDNVNTASRKWECGIIMMCASILSKLKNVHLQNLFFSDSLLGLFNSFCYTPSPGLITFFQAPYFLLPQLPSKEWVVIFITIVCQFSIGLIVITWFNCLNNALIVESISIDSSWDRAITFGQEIYET